jgi:hypothetical protein
MIFSVGSGGVGGRGANGTAIETVAAAIVAGATDHEMNLNASDSTGRRRFRQAGPVGEVVGRRGHRRAIDGISVRRRGTAWDRHRMERGRRVKSRFRGAARSRQLNRKR